MTGARLPENDGLRERKQHQGKKVRYYSTNTSDFAAVINVKAERTDITFVEAILHLLSLILRHQSVTGGSCRVRCISPSLLLFFLPLLLSLLKAENILQQE